MKKLSIMFAIMLLTALLSAEQVGTMRFILGDVHYKEAPGTEFVKAKNNSPITLTGEIRTAADASVEILWKSGETSKIGAGKTISIRRLHEEMSASGSWDLKLKRQISNLFSPKKTTETTVAGVRRDEVKITQATELYWSEEELANLQTAYELYNKESYNEAIPVFEQIIEQGPLKKEAEVSHALLILIYHKLGNSAKLKQHQDLLKADFPSSTLGAQIPGAQ